jgi:peptide-methionine (S)-S-oxide reductase
MDNPRGFPQTGAAARFASAVLLAAAAIAILAGGLARHASAEQARLVPAPQGAAAAADNAPSEVAVLAGGCFWGVQGVFQHVKGVTSAKSGYTGGDRQSADYEKVSMGNTGHAESVRIQFDPRQVSYGQLLQIYFSVVHDPTELNRQGPDTGTQYRSAIFPQSDAQAAISQAYIAQLTAAHAFDQPIVTRIERNQHFYEAEAYHQDYLTLNPDNPYIAFNDLPKVANLKRLFPQLYLPDPVLVRASR